MKRGRVGRVWCSFRTRLFYHESASLIHTRQKTLFFLAFVCRAQEHLGEGIMTFPPFYMR